MDDRVAAHDGFLLGFAGSDMSSKTHRCYLLVDANRAEEVCCDDLEAMIGHSLIAGPPDDAGVWDFPSPICDLLASPLSIAALFIGFQNPQLLLPNWWSIAGSAMGRRDGCWRRPFVVQISQTKSLMLPRSGLEFLPGRMRNVDWVGRWPGDRGWTGCCDRWATDFLLSWTDDRWRHARTVLPWLDH